MKPFFTEADCDDQTTVIDVTPSRWIRLDIANAILAERGKVVYGRVDGDHGWFDSSRTYCSLDGMGKGGRATHRATLINIGPLKSEDSAEKFVKDWLETYGTYSYEEMAKRARRLLERGG